MSDLEHKLWAKHRRNQLAIKNIERVLLSLSGSGVYFSFSKEWVTSCTDWRVQVGAMFGAFLFWLPLAWIKATATAHLENFERRKAALPPKADG